MTRRVRRTRTKREWGPGFRILLMFGHDFFRDLDHTPDTTELRAAWKDLGDWDRCV